MPNKPRKKKKLKVVYGWIEDHPIYWRCPECETTNDDYEYGMHVICWKCEIKFLLKEKK